MIVLFLHNPKLGDFFAGIGCVRSHLGQKTLWHTDLCTHTHTQESIVSCPNLRGELFGPWVGTMVGMWFGLDVTN